MTTQTKIERSVHNTLNKALRTLIQRHKGTKMLYLYFPQDKAAIVVYKAEDYNRWVAETTKDVKVKGV